MAKSYSAQGKIHTWKTHTCVACESQYRYLLDRDITASGKSPEKAQAALAKALETALASDVDVHPCPTCGVYQPDMLNTRRATAHRVVLWMTSIPLAALAMLCVANVIGMNVTAYAMAGICLVSAFLQWRIASGNKNADLDANRAAASELVTTGKLFHDRPGRAGGVELEHTASPMNFGRWLGVGSLVAAAGLVFFPEIQRSVAGTPLNAAFVPPVIGPGDTAKFYFDEKIESMKGLWRGTADATAHLDGGDIVPLNASAKNDTWGDDIRAKRSQKADDSTLWIDIEIPNDPQLAGKTITVEMSVQAQFPHSVGNGFVIAEAGATATEKIQLAGVGAGTLYTKSFWTSALAAIALAIFGGWSLKRHARRDIGRALPTTISDVEAEEAEVVEVDETEPATDERR